MKGKSFEVKKNIHTILLTQIWVIRVNNISEKVLVENIILREMYNTVE